MITTKEYRNDFGGGKFYIAEATVIKKRVTGDTRKEALKNLKDIMRDKIGVDLFAPTAK